MNIGERLKELRIKKGISVDALAEEVGISRATIYRYENESIKKIPVDIMEKLCQALKVKPYELLQDNREEDKIELPDSTDFEDPEAAIAFLLRLPSVAAFGGYDIDKMDDATILAFANEILHQIETVSYKFKN